MTGYQEKKLVSKEPSLCVDLDGTLIYSDLLFESLFALLRRNILMIFMLPVWLLMGKAEFKHEIARRVDIDVKLLPYNRDLLSYLKEQHSTGRLLVLVTASNSKYAEQIAEHLGIFDQVYSSDNKTNLKGLRKQALLVQIFGEGDFDYVANERTDLLIWERARKGIVVNASSSVTEAAYKVVSVDRVINGPERNAFSYLKAIRLHQWIKNILIFIPLITAHKVTDPQLVFQTLVAFVSFSLCASSVYLLNDLLDLPEDRRHPTKQYRPLAAGTIPITHGTLMIPILFFTAVIMGLLLPLKFLLVLLGYFGITLCYSLFIKRIALLDVLTLAGLYTLRVIAGAAAATIALSFWLLAISMFIFLSLALVKRYSELLFAGNGEDSYENGRAYSTKDRESLALFGVTSGYLSVLVLALYVDSEQVRTLYTHPKAIWLLCPLLLYWISRVWLLARRGEMHEDPVVFAIEDRTSHWLVLVGLFILWLAT